jgi:hypothetical protein
MTFNNYNLYQKKYKGVPRNEKPKYDKNIDYSEEEPTIQPPPLPTTQPPPLPTTQPPPLPTTQPPPLPEPQPEPELQPLPDEPEPELEPQPEPREVMKFNNYKAYDEYNKLYKLENNIKRLEFGKDRIKKIPEVGDIFIDYSKNSYYINDKIAIITKINNKSYFYKYLKNQEISKIFNNNDWGQSKTAFKYSKDLIDNTRNQKSKRIKKIATIEMREYENGFILDEFVYKH